MASQRYNSRLDDSPPSQVSLEMLRRVAGQVKYCHHRETRDSVSALQKSTQPYATRLYDLVSPYSSIQGTYQHKKARRLRQEITDLNTGIADSLSKAVEVIWERCCWLGRRPKAWGSGSTRRNIERIQYKKDGKMVGELLFGLDDIKFPLSWVEPSTSPIRRKRGHVENDSEPDSSSDRQTKRFRRSIDDWMQGIPTVSSYERSSNRAPEGVFNQSSDVKDVPWKVDKTLTRVRASLSPKTVSSSSPSPIMDQSRPIESSQKDTARIPFIHQPFKYDSNSMPIQPTQNSHLALHGSPNLIAASILKTTEWSEFSNPLNHPLRRELTKTCLKKYSSRKKFKGMKEAQIQNQMIEDVVNWWKEKDESLVKLGDESK